MHVFHKQRTCNLSYQIGLVKAFKEHDHAYISFELGIFCSCLTPLGLYDMFCVLCLMPLRLYSMCYLSSPNAYAAIWLVFLIISV